MDNSVKITLGIVGGVLGLMILVDATRRSGPSTTQAATVSHRTDSTSINAQPQASSPTSSQAASIAPSPESASSAPTSDHAIFGDGTPSDSEASLRMKWAEGLTIMANYKGWPLETYTSATAPDWPPQAPVHLENGDPKKGNGDNAMLTLWAKNASLNTDNLQTIVQSDSAEQNIAKLKFHQIVLVDPDNYCYAVVLPEPLGIGEFKCNNRQQQQ